MTASGDSGEALEVLGPRVKQLREARGRARAAGADDEDAISGRLQEALGVVLPRAAEANVRRDTLLGWIGEPDTVTRDSETVGRLVARLDDALLPPRTPASPTQLEVIDFCVGHPMGGQTNFYVVFRKDDGSIHAAFEHTAFPE